MNAVTLAVIEAIERAGAEVQIEIGPDGAEVGATIDGHLHIVRDPDVYRALCLAAEACRVELGDGRVTASDGIMPVTRSIQIGKGLI